MYKYTKDDECILTEEEQAIIVDWVRNHYKYFHNNGSRNGEKKYFQKLKYFKNIPECVWDIKKRIFDKEQLYDCEQEELFKDSIGIMFDGSELHLHTDPNPTDSNLIHTRYNVYVQLPIKGGYPIYNNIQCKLKERTYICCRSGIDKHCCVKVEGDRERIVLSFGVLLPFERIQNIIYEYDQSTETIGHVAENVTE